MSPVLNRGLLVLAYQGLGDANRGFSIVKVQRSLRLIAYFLQATKHSICLPFLILENRTDAFQCGDVHCARNQTVAHVNFAAIMKLQNGLNNTGATEVGCDWTGREGLDPIA